MIWEYLVLASLAGLFGVGWIVFADSPARRVEKLVEKKVELPERAVPLLLPHYQQAHGSGCALSLVLMTVIVLGLNAMEVVGLGGSFILSAVGSILAFVAGGVIGSRVTKPQGSVAPLLSDLASHAAHKASILEAEGDSEGAEAARGLSRWARDISSNVPDLTLTALEQYYTRYEVANILEGFFFDQSDDHFLGKCLATTPEMLFDSPDEAERVAILAEVQSLDEIRTYGRTLLRSASVEDPYKRPREVIDRLREKSPDP